MSVPAENNPTGSYRRCFSIPDNWLGRRIYLRFEGVDSAFHLWINEQQAGYSQDSRLPAEFDITHLVRFGEENWISVRVYRWSDGSYLEDQDFWRLSGIYRDVLLWSAPALQMRDVQINTSLRTPYQNAELNI